ncbi:MAG TPA: cysteine--tRNA ligase, partial [Chryseobacterium sp.]|nr:cysteine--tRNA ligase [Chryseobacterium sp.]
ILPMELVSGKNDFFEKPFHPAIVRFNFLQAHYRSVLDISNEAMVASEKGFQRLMEAMKIVSGFAFKMSDSSSFDISAWKEKCYAALTDDFNSPILISYLFEAVNFIFKLKDEKETINEADLKELQQLMNGFVFDVLGLQNVEENNNEKLDQTLQVLIELRNQARKSKNFELSDQIRDRLLAEGIELKDGRDGTTYSLN